MIQRSNEPMARWLVALVSVAPVSLWSGDPSTWVVGEPGGLTPGGSVVCGLGGVPKYQGASGEPVSLVSGEPMVCGSGKSGVCEIVA